MSLNRLIRLVDDSRYAEELGTITLAELFAAGPTLPRALLDSSDVQAVLEVFRGAPDAWFSSGFFVKNLGLQRWTAQKICGELAVYGLLERSGRTSSTRYRLARTRAHVIWERL